MPYRDMLATMVITGTESICLLSEKGNHDSIYDYDVGAGYPVESNMLKYEQVINKDDNDELIVEQFTRRFVHYFGLDISESFRDEKGQLNLPKAFVN